MTSIVSICNLALSNVGKPEIQDIAEDSAEAVACNRFYQHTLDALLQTYPWRFAQTTAALASVTNTKADRWEYAYQRPSDCLKVLRVSDIYDLPYSPSDGSLIIAGAPAYDIEGDTVFCYVDPAYLTYTRRLTDPTKFPPLFVEALSWHLAVRLAMPLTRDPKVRADAYQLAVQTFGQAGVADANEVREVEDVRSRAIEGR